MAKTIIETVVIVPTKDMPLGVFKQLHHQAYFMELMEHLPDGRVVWDDEVSSIVSDDMADMSYYLLQNDMFSMEMELPKKVVEKLV